MSLNAIAPTEFLDDLAADICAKRGRILGMEPQGTAHLIKALCPLANLFGYAGQHRNLTQDHASFTMHSEHYEAVPLSIAEEIIERRRTRHGTRRSPTA